MFSNLKNLKDKQYAGVKELADESERLLREMGADQGKATVSEYPSERTVRYYISERLIPEPVGKEGAASIFGYEHLIALLTIKKLQSDRLPIRVIRSLIAGRDVESLEKLLNEEVTTFTDRSALEEYRKTIGHTDDSDVTVISDMVGRDEYLKKVSEKNKAKEYLQTLLPRHQSRAEELDSETFDMVSPDPSQPPAPTTKPRAVSRYEIARGVVLSIDEKFRAPADLSALLLEIENILRSWRR